MRGRERREEERKLWRCRRGGGGFHYASVNPPISQSIICRFLHLSFCLSVYSCINQCCSSGRQRAGGSDQGLRRGQQGELRVCQPRPEPKPRPGAANVRQIDRALHIFTKIFSAYSVHELACLPRLSHSSFSCQGSLCQGQLFLRGPGGVPRGPERPQDPDPACPCREVSSRERERNGYLIDLSRSYVI